jgi:pimeloyl-ACP methyl ester carboxylesterase
VLISTSPGPLFEKVLLRLPGVGWRIPLMHFVPVWNTKLVTRVCKRLLSEGSLDAHPVDFQSLRSRSDAAVDRAGWRATEWQQIRALRLALRGFDVRNRLGQLDTRVIILHGTEDALFDLDEAFELERRLPNAHLWIVKGAAHALPLTHPAQVLEAVRSLRHGQEQHPER